MNKLKKILVQGFLKLELDKFKKNVKKSLKTKAKKLNVDKIVKKAKKRSKETLDKLKMDKAVDKIKKSGDSTIEQIKNAGEKIEVGKMVNKAKNFLLKTFTNSVSSRKKENKNDK